MIFLSTFTLWLKYIKESLSEKMSDNIPDDIQLVRSLQKGDIKAFDRLFEKYARRLLYFARGYIGIKEDAEGIVQEVFIKIWENRKEIKEHYSFQSFIFTITYNVIRKYFRAKYTEQKYLNLFLEDFEESVDNTKLEIEYYDILEQVNLAIDHLPRKRKEIFKLSREEGLSHKEIARIMGISPKTVENHIHEAIRQIKKHLRKIFPE